MYTYVLLFIMYGIIVLFAMYYVRVYECTGCTRGGKARPHKDIMSEGTRTLAQLQDAAPQTLARDGCGVARDDLNRDCTAARTLIARPLAALSLAAGPDHACIVHSAC